MDGIAHSAPIGSPGPAVLGLAKHRHLVPSDPTIWAVKSCIAPVPPVVADPMSRSATAAFAATGSDTIHTPDPPAADHERPL